MPSWVLFVQCTTYTVSGTDMTKQLASKIDKLNAVQKNCLAIVSSMILRGINFDIVLPVGSRTSHEELKVFQR